MIVVHHLENSRSQRVLWLLEELALPYEVKRYARDPSTMLAPPALANVHPLGKSPVIDDVDDEGRGRVIAETGAIVEYLVDSANGALGAPGNRDEALRYRHFLHYAEGSLMPPLLAMLVVKRLGILGRPARAQLQHMFDVHLDWMDAELATRPWFAGDDFTAADVMMSFPIEAARSRAGAGTRANLMDWLERCHARPAYARALATGGPYAYA